MTESHKAIASSLLPQYSGSAAFMDRFLLAIHEDGQEIERSQNDQKIKLVDQKEIASDALDYFTSSKPKMEEDFFTDISGRIGKTKANFFCDVLANDWYDGRALRNGPRVRSLKLSVYCYLSALLEDSGDISNIVINQDNFSGVTQELSMQDIAAILTVNDQMLYQHIEAWKSQHPNVFMLSTDDIFIRRGLALKEELDTSVLYKEWDFLNSYSIAFSAPEKFSQMTIGSLPAIVNGNINLFKNRILFFSPFIPGMISGQLEVGVIPSLKLLPIASQGVHGGIHEYILDPAPFEINRL